MNKLLSYSIVFVLLIGFTSSLSAQTGTYKPDTTLNYDIFLDQCINFKNMEREEVWVVFFWASWDSRSLFELDPLKSTHSLFKEKPVRFVGVSVDKIRNRWETALMREQMPWEQLMISDIDNYEFIKKAFRHNSIPAIFLVNSQGTIRRMADTQELRSELYIATRFLPDRPYTKPVSEAIIEDLSTFSEQEDIPVIPAPPEREVEVQPQPEPERAPAKEPQWLTHKVRGGETLYRLYVRYGVSVAEIKRINGLRNNTIRTGQVLKVKRLED